MGAKKLAEGGEAAKVGHHHRDDAFLTAELKALRGLEDARDDLVGEVAAEGAAHEGALALEAIFGRRELGDGVVQALSRPVGAAVVGDAACKLDALHFLFGVVARAKAEGTNLGRDVGDPREDDDGHRRRLGGVAETCDELEAVELWHLEVQEDHRGPKTCRDILGLRRIAAALKDDIGLCVELLMKRTADDLRVIHQEHPRVTLDLKRLDVVLGGRGLRALR